MEPLSPAAQNALEGLNAVRFVRRNAATFAAALAFALGSASIATAQPPDPTQSDAAFNTAAGTDALLVTTGATNTAVGYKALTSNQTGAANTAVGFRALSSNPTGAENTAVGSNALLSNLTGGSNTAVGNSALAHNTAGGSNTASGWLALYTNESGSFNTATGSGALIQNISGGSNTASGSSALHANGNGSFNTADGASALFSNVFGTNNTSVGAEAMYANLVGNYNAVIGNSALHENTKGNDNTASGAAALYYNVDGNNNVATGADALLTNAHGSSNTASGTDALRNNTTGNNNTAIGIFAGVNLQAGDGNLYIASPGGAANESNTTRIGSAQTSAFIAGVRGVRVDDAVEVVIDSNGQLGTRHSSARFKEDIKDMAAYSRRLLDLRPVTFRYKQPAADGGKPVEPGLIAEEVAEVYPDLVAHGADGRIEAVQYDKLTPMLLNEVQNQERQLAAEAGRNAALEAEVHDLRANLAEARRSQDALADRLAKLESTSRAPGAQ